MGAREVKIAVVIQRSTISGRFVIVLVVTSESLEDAVGKSMPKEDRSDWVAVAPESTASLTKEIKKPLSAFQYYQKHVGPQIKAELGQPFSVAAFTKACHGRWHEMSDEAKEPFTELARKDQDRYHEEQAAADQAARERLERIERERESFMYDDSGQAGKRTTRGGYDKQQKKKARKERKERKKNANEEYEDDEASSEWDSEEDSDDDKGERKKKKSSPKPKRQMSAKQTEYQQKKKQERLDKEAYIAERQQDLRKEKAAQAKKRLEFLLKQSNIFSHFGQVQEDTAKYGIKAQDGKAGSAQAGSRRRDAKEESQEEELEEADEHTATYLTKQPSTLGFGTMRAYQLEGLNWMIRLQENGVNGILADEVRDHLHNFQKVMVYYDS